MLKLRVGIWGHGWGNILERKECAPTTLEKKGVGKEKARRRRRWRRVREPTTWGNKKAGTRGRRVQAGEWTGLEDPVRTSPNASLTSRERVTLTYVI